MIHELRTYTLLPGKLGEYLKLAVDAEREVFGGDTDKFGKFEGQWVHRVRHVEPGHHPRRLP